MMCGKLVLVPFASVILLSLFALPPLFPSPLPQSPPSPAEAARSILDRHCLACHGERQLSGLDMRRRETLLTGGSRGPAVLPGKAPSSLLFQAASHLGELKMPPDKPPLPPQDLEILRQWYR